jgi:hypothetical protein
MKRAYSVKSRLNVIPQGLQYITVEQYEGYMCKWNVEKGTVEVSRCTFPQQLTSNLKFPYIFRKTSTTEGPYCFTCQTLGDTVP